MTHHRLGHIEILITVQAGPVSQIHIFQLGKMILV